MKKCTNKEQSKYSVNAQISCKQHLEYVPYSMDIDFGHLLQEKGAKGSFDRFSVQVKKIEKTTGELIDVAFSLSDEFLEGDKGKISWLIENTDDNQFRIFFDVKENGPFHPPSKIGIIGNGDCLRFNDGVLHPLFFGLSFNPVAIDWDGDGITDILFPQTYSLNIGSPWWTIRFFKNEGTNEQPIFGEGIPLKYRDADGSFKYIHPGLKIELVDWNNDGLMDIVAFPYSFYYPVKYETPIIWIFINTGEYDCHGLPILELKHSIPVKLEDQYCSLKVVDWREDGRKSIIIGYYTTQYFEKNDELWFPASAEEKNQAKWPRRMLKTQFYLYENLSDDPDNPVFLEPKNLYDSENKEITFYGIPCMEIMDWDGDGKFDLIIGCDMLEMDKGYTKLYFYKNVGAKGSPAFMNMGDTKLFRERVGVYFSHADTAAFKGLLVTQQLYSGRIKYYRFSGRDDNDLPQFEDMGFIKQRNTYLNSYSTFSQGYFCDYDGDGDLDLITGNEEGYVLRAENIGTRKSPVFKEPEFFTQDGKAIELLNGLFGDSIYCRFTEGMIGQTSPMYIDWDGDGVMDLIVVISQKLLFFKNAGTNAKPCLFKPVEIRTESGKKVIRFRSKPIVMDWDGDGLVDIIGHDTEDSFLYYFRRYRDENSGELKLAEGIPLKYADGSYIVPREWHDYFKYYNAADWNRSGSYDIFVSASDIIMYLQNVGDNSNPVFLKPVRLSVDGEPISVSHHESAPFPVDWDGRGVLDLVVSGESGLFYLFRRSYLEGYHKRITCTIE